MAKELKLLNPRMVTLQLTIDQANKIVGLIGNERDNLDSNDDLSYQQKEDAEVYLSELQDFIENAVHNREQEGEPRD